MGICILTRSKEHFVFMTWQIPDGYVGFIHQLVPVRQPQRQLVRVRQPVRQVPVVQRQLLQQQVRVQQFN